MNTSNQTHPCAATHRIFCLWLSVLFLLTSLAASARAEEILNNKSIIELHRLDLGDSVLIEKIKTSKCEFDTSLEGLKHLKEANLSDEVIKAMVARGSGGQVVVVSPRAPAVAGDVNDPKAMHPPGVWLYEEKDGKAKMTQLVGEVYDISHVVAPFVHTSDAVLQGTKAAVQINNPRPVFYIYSGNWEYGFWAADPTQMPLVRLDVKDKASKQDRHIQLSRGGPYGGSYGIASKAIIPINSESVTSNSVKVSPRDDLPEGEYSFCWLVGRSVAGKMYTFGLHNN